MSVPFVGLPIERNGNLTNPKGVFPCVELLDADARATLHRLETTADTIRRCAFSIAILFKKHLRARTYPLR